MHPFPPQISLSRFLGRRASTVARLPTRHANRHPQVKTVNALSIEDRHPTLIDQYPGSESLIQFRPVAHRMSLTVDQSVRSLTVACLQLMLTLSSVSVITHDTIIQQQTSLPEIAQATYPSFAFHPPLPSLPSFAP